MAYCITCIEGKAAKHLGPCVSIKSKKPLTTIDRIFKFLKIIFTNRLTKKKTYKAIGKLKFFLGSLFYNFIINFRIKA